MEPTKFNGGEGSPINLNTAIRWTANYRREREKLGKAYIKANFFGFELIQEILSEKGCMGIRIYYAIDDLGRQQLLLVGVDADMNNLLPDSMERSGARRTIADSSMPCPNYCPSYDDPLSGSGD